MFELVHGPLGPRFNVLFVERLPIALILITATRTEVSFKKNLIITAMLQISACVFSNKYWNLKWSFWIIFLLLNWLPEATYLQAPGDFFWYYDVLFVSIVI